jgi:hypothetical protein
MPKELITSWCSTTLIKRWDFFLSQIATRIFQAQSLEFTEGEWRFY